MSFLHCFGLTLGSSGFGTQVLGCFELTGVDRVFSNNGLGPFRVSFAYGFGFRSLACVRALSAWSPCLWLLLNNFYSKRPLFLWERLKGPFWEELPYRNFTETRTSPCMKRTLMRRSLTLQGPLADPLCWEAVPLRQELLTASASFQERHHYQKRHQELVDPVCEKTPSFTRRAGKGRRPQIAPGPDSKAPPPPPRFLRASLGESGEGFFMASSAGRYVKNS